MAAPTLETNAAADTLRILSGTPGDPVTWNDVWDWDDGGGSFGGAGDVPKDGGGTAKVNTFMTETIADGVYLILKNIQFGDDVTPSYFQSKNEMVYFNIDCLFAVNDNAILTLGEKDGDYGINGSFWSIQYTTASMYVYHTMNMYASRLHLREDSSYCSFYVDEDVCEFINVQLSGTGTTSSTMQFRFRGSNLTLKKVYSNNLYSGFRLHTNPAIFEECHSHKTAAGGAIYASGNEEMTASEARMTSVGVGSPSARSDNLARLNVIDIKGDVGTVYIYSDGGWIKEQYTCNVHIANKDGADLAGVAVDCEDTNGDAVWAAGTIVTDAAGDIAEQVITYKKWEGTDETLTEYSPHKFTISKAGYETLVLDNITIDSPIVWHEELQDSGSQRPRFRMHGA